METHSSMNNVVHDKKKIQGKNIVFNHSLCSYHVTSSCQTRSLFIVVEIANPKSLNSLLDPRYEGLKNTKN